MSTAELKLQLIQLISNTEDTSLLKKAYASLSKLLSKEDDWWDTISTKEKQLIEKGLKQLENGEGIPHNVVRKRVEKLLTGK